jgi:hypothetical protein
MYSIMPWPSCLWLRLNFMFLTPKLVKKGLILRRGYSFPPA